MFEVDNRLIIIISSVYVFANKKPSKPRILGMTGIASNGANMYEGQSTRLVAFGKEVLSRKAKSQGSNLVSPPGRVLVLRPLSSESYE